jgi:hypothetical protein
MLTALYSMFVLAEWAVLSVMLSQFILDYAWEKTVKFLTFNNLWNHPDIKHIIANLHKGK